MNPEFLLFIFLAAVAVTTAILMVTQRNPVMSAVCLIGNFFALAGLYLLLRAQFLAVLQIIVYTGAIMVLVIFVIMLLNLGEERNLRERLNFRSSLGVVFASGLLLELVAILGLRGVPEMTLTVAPVSATMGTVEGIGSALFGPFVFPFEITSLLLLAAIVGAVLLAKRRV
ncbi:MAG: NADH-quinone oxidoreductase subunit J [Bacteroidota bacterium]